MVILEDKMGDQPQVGAGTAQGSGRIQRSSADRTRKKKRNQIPLGIVVLLLIIAAGIILDRTSGGDSALFWILGLAFGFILQRSRFCFTASMRDPYLTGSTSLTKAVLLAFAITTIGFTAIKYGAFSRGLPIPGQSFVVPISLATAVGAFIFGIGMVIAGGCASGTLMRVGEGFGMQILSLVFFIAGSLLGAAHFGWWKLNFIVKGPAVFLPDLFGWIGAVAVQLLIIALLWIAADKWAKRKNATGSH
jgi:uncharacterized membrane protein YedE/YeeE